jgi:hypothetical protein
MEELLSSCRRNHISLILSAVAAQPGEAMRQSGFLQRLGEENVVKDIYEALERAAQHVEIPHPGP